MKQVLSWFSVVATLTTFAPGAFANPHKFSQEECAQKLYVGAGAEWHQAAEICSQRRDKAYVLCMVQRYDQNPFATLENVARECASIRLLPEDQMVEDCFALVAPKMSNAGARAFCEWSQGTNTLILPKCVNLNYSSKTPIDNVVNSCYSQYQRGELNEHGQNKRVLEEQRRERERIAAEEKRREEQRRLAAEMKRQEAERKAQERALQEQLRQQKRAQEAEAKRLAALERARQQELAAQKKRAVAPVPPQVVPVTPVTIQPAPVAVTRPPVPPKVVPSPKPVAIPPAVVTTSKRNPVVLPAPASQRPTPERLEEQKQAAARAEAERKKKEEEERKKKEAEEKAKLAVPLLPNDGSGVITDLPNFE